jgi:hypothetical protein
LAISAVVGIVVGIIVWKVSSTKQETAVDTTTPSSTEQGTSTSPALSPTTTPSPIIISITPAPFSFMQCEDATQTQNNCCNGLDNICDLGVDEIFYAGVHNAMASFEGGFLFQQNHQLQLEGALEAGYRGINLDVCNCNGEYQLCHGICNFGARDPVETFASINSFLDENPTETILIILEINNGVDETVDLDEVYNILSGVDGLVEKIYVHNDRTAPWPSLREVVYANTVRSSNVLVSIC